MTGFFTAWQFLTILPVPGSAALGPAVRWCPAVGLGLGALLALVDLLLTPSLGGTTRAAVLVATLAVLTGALHLDGLADSADGALAPRTAEERLAIMRDPRAGSFGVTAIVLVLSLKIAALVDLTGPLRLPAIILLPALSRWVIVVQGRLFPPARPGAGLGAVWREGSSWPAIGVASILAIGPTIVVSPPWGALLALAMLAGGLMLGAWFTSRIGGLTGDTYGATVEVTEAIGWIAISAVGRTLV